MADVNMNLGNQPLPAEVQAYITNLQAQLAAAQYGSAACQTIQTYPV